MSREWSTASMDARRFKAESRAAKLERELERALEWKRGAERMGERNGRLYLELRAKVWRRLGRFSYWLGLIERPEKCEECGR
jgi:hypothetical protein